MNNTTHYELKKPEATDFYNIDDFNDNADLIDTLIYEHGEGAEQESSPAGTDFLQLIGGSDSKLYKALISDIADTVLRKLAVSTSETGLASGSVIEKINSLNGKLSLISNGKKAMPIETYESTVSFRAAAGSPTESDGMEALADTMKADGITQYFGTIHNKTSGGVYTVITGGANADYFAILMFGYNSNYVGIYRYRGGTYYVTKMYDTFLF